MAQICTKSFSGWGFAPDPQRSPVPLAGKRGKEREGGGGRGRENRRGKEGKGREGRLPPLKFKSGKKSWDKGVPLSQLFLSLSRGDG